MFYAIASKNIKKLYIKKDILGLLQIQDFSVKNSTVDLVGECSDDVLLLQFRRKQKLAEQLKEQQRELAEKQKERESMLKLLKSEVSQASDSAGIQLMQMNRLKAIQEEAIHMQEQQHKEIEFLKAELQVCMCTYLNMCAHACACACVCVPCDVIQMMGTSVRIPSVSLCCYLYLPSQRKADLTGEQEEIERLRAEAKKLEAAQAQQRAKLDKEKQSLQQQMCAQSEVEKEMQNIQREKEKREEAEKNLRQALAMETRAMEKLSAEAAQRKSEIDALQAEKEAKQKEIEGVEKEQLQQELEDLRRRKEELSENEARIAREKQELQQLNRQRELELQELEAVRCV